MAVNHKTERGGSGPIPRGWRGWARNRERELCAGGVTRASARKFAEVEARGRAAIAASLGEKAARAARLAWVDDGAGQGRFVLAPGPEKLPCGVTFHALFASPGLASNI